MTRRRRSPADIAFHEAGHAVAATVSGLAIMYAKIEDGGGAVRLNQDEYEPRTREHAERLGVVFLAGFAVLSIRDGLEAGFKQGSSRSLPPFADDTWEFNDILQHACPPPPTPANPDPANPAGPQRHLAAQGSGSRDLAPAPVSPFAVVFGGRDHRAVHRHWST